MNYTSIEQSKKLLELGLSPDTADMHYLDFSNKEYGCIASPYRNIENSVEKSWTIPCWSVGSLLDIMLPIIITSQGVYYLKVLKADCGYSVRYKSDTHEILLSTYQQELIDACYELIRLLLKHNYITKTKQL